MGTTVIVLCINPRLPCCLLTVAGVNSVCTLVSLKLTTLFAVKHFLNDRCLLILLVHFLAVRPFLSSKQSLGTNVNPVNNLLRYNAHDLKLLVLLSHNTVGHIVLGFLFCFATLIGSAHLFVWGHCKILFSLVQTAFILCPGSLLGRHSFMGWRKCSEQGFQTVFRHPIYHQVSCAVMLFDIVHKVSLFW